MMHFLPADKIYFDGYERGPLFAAHSPDSDGDRRLWVKENVGYNDQADAQWLIELVGTDDHTGKVMYKINNLRYKSALYCSNQGDGDGDHKGWAKKDANYNDNNNARWVLRKV